MTKQNAQQSFPVLLKVIQFLNYFTAIGSVLFGLLYLFTSPENAASIFGDIQPLNQYAVGLLYLALAAVMAVVIYSIRKRKTFAPYVFVLAMYASAPMTMLVDYYSGISYEDDVMLIVGTAISYTVTLLAMAYMLFNKQVRKIFTSDK